MLELVYISRAAKRQSPQELAKLLAKSREFNLNADISGLLLYDGFGTFIQALEGDDTEVESLFNKIKQDTRHSHIHVLGSSHIKTRSFGDWRMGYRLLPAKGAPLHTGYSDFLDNAEEPATQSTISFAYKMLTHFKCNVSNNNEEL